MITNLSTIDVRPKGFNMIRVGEFKCKHSRSLGQKVSPDTGEKVKFSGMDAMVTSGKNSDPKIICRLYSTIVCPFFNNHSIPGFQNSGNYIQG